MLRQLVGKITLCGIRLQLGQDVPDSGQKHPAYSDNRFLVPTMKQYIGTKIIEAEPAYRCMDGQGRVTITDDPSEAFPNFPSVEDGYRVRYADGYVSWSPKDTFERAYLPLETNKELRTSKPSISQEMVDNFILETWTQTAGEKTTIVRAMLRNGFELVEASSCVSPENYDEKLGREICMKKIKDRVWQLLGFLLQTAVNGVK